MKNFNKLASLLMAGLLLTGSMAFTACDDDLDTNQVSGGLKISAFGPCPILRLDDMRIVGSQLNKVDKVIFPSGIEVTEFASKTANEIIVTVPDEAVPGHIKLVAGRDTVESVTNLTFQEPIEVTSITPTSGLVAGDIVTINGEYVYNIAAVTFPEGVVVKAEDFVTITRKQIQVRVPLEAVSGTVSLDDGGDWLLDWTTALQIKTAQYASISTTTPDFGDVITITGQNLQLVEKLAFPGNVEVPFATNAAGTEITATVPEDCAASGAITLTQYSTLTATTDELTLPAIWFTSIDPASDLAAGDLVTIKGGNFDRVKQLLLPGGKEGAYTLVDNETITFEVPDGMGDGQVTLIQNANIVITTDLIATKKTGNVFWTGEFDVAEWNGWMQLVDWNATEWDIFKNAISAPGTLTIEFDEKTDLTYWQLKLQYADWTTNFENIGTDVVKMAEGQTAFSFDVTQADVDALHNMGWVFGGYGLIIKSFAFKSAATIWSGETTITWGDGGRVLLPASAFEGVEAGTKLVLCYDQIDQTWGQVQINYGDWSGINFVNEGIDQTVVPTDVYGWEFDSRETALTLTQEILDNIQAKKGECEGVTDCGIIIQGSDLIFKEVRLEK